ncbi:MAG: TetR/AcrR family transcriptional regulator C-terminal domain-containing protein [Lachnospiraceae bacterium]|nr:TetR/AcrR family transcriptional regulator C-terminal domain-containing protein [Lachnospiraceae bacterium]
MASFTEKEIKKSFLGLLNCKKLADISVKDIVDDCRINRSSFYYHFTDIPTLLKSIMIESTSEIIRQYPETKSATQCVRELLDFMLENKRAVLHVYRSASREMMSSLLTKGISYGSDYYVEHAFRNSGVDEEEKRILKEYCKFFLLGFTVDWLESGLQKEKADDLMKILEQSGADILPFEDLITEVPEETNDSDKIEKLSDYRTRHVI